VECHLKDEVVGNNFKIIMECLKSLNLSQNELSNRFDRLEERVDSNDNEKGERVENGGMDRGEK
jgi:hypothetical protein